MDDGHHCQGIVCLHVLHNVVLFSIKYTDIIECTSNNGYCEHSCINTIGSYKCLCDEGYVLNSNARSCSGIYYSLLDYNFKIFVIDIDEYDIFPYICDHFCTNTDGSYVCECEIGYVLENGHDCRGKE